jgi:hypothetical protein
MCMLHEEGQKSYMLCVCNIREEKVMCLVYVTWGKTKVVSVKCMLDEVGKT